MKKKEMKKLVELLSAVVAFLDEIAESADEDTAVAETEAEEKVTKKSAKKSSKKVEEPVEEEIEEDEEVDEEVDVDSLSYNDLKAYAKKIGVKAVGSRSQVLSAVKEALGADEEDEEEEEAPKDKSSKKSSKKEEPKKSSKKVIPINEEVEDEEEEDEDNELLEQLNEMSLEELADILSEAGLSTKGKKEALISRVVKGIEDGVIEFEDEEDEDVEEEDEVDDSEDDGNEYDLNDVDNPDMPKARATAIKALKKEVEANFKKKKASAVKEMSNYLIDELGVSKKELKSLDDNGIKDLYFDRIASFINDEGEEVGLEEPYEVNGLSACCGHLLEYDEENGSYICSVCGAEYEADEEE